MKTSPALERNPPFEANSEQGVIGCMLLGRVAEARALLEPGDFYVPANATLFRVCCALADRGEPVDLVTVIDELEDCGQLDAVNGREYVVGCSRRPRAAASLGGYARRVRRAAFQRRVIDVGCKTLEMGYEWHGDPGRLLQEIQALAATLATTSPHLTLKGEANEVRLRRFDLGSLEPADPEAELRSLPLLGTPGYFLEGFSHLLSIAPKGGKSDLLYCCLPQWVAEGRRVLWLSEEGELVWKLRRAYPGYLVPAGPVEVVMSLGEDSETLLAYAMDAPADVVIADTCRNTMGIVDENDNAEVSRVVRRWEACLRKHQPDRTTFYCHHDNKSGGEYGRGVAGATAFLAAVDRVLELERVSNYPNRRLIKVLSRITDAEDLLYELQGGRLLDGGKLVALGAPNALSRAEACLTVAEALSAEWSGTTEVWQRAGGKDALARNDCLSALTDLFRRGEAERDPTEDQRGKPYRWRAPQPHLIRPILKDEVRLGGRDAPSRNGHDPTIDELFPGLPVAAAPRGLEGS